MNVKQARANVNPVRQRSQYSCMATSMMMCLKAHGVDTTEDEVNRVMGAAPMRGAAWEDAIACAQYYGMRATLVCPCTVQQLKQWTDAGTPVMIAWNPEGRDWSHASVVFDVDDNEIVYIADPNIPDPEETVRKIYKKTFYKKWFEKWPNYLVRRPAMAITREVTEEGRPILATFHMRTSPQIVQIKNRIAVKKVLAGPRFNIFQTNEKGKKKTQIGDAASMTYALDLIKKTGIGNVSRIDDYELQDDLGNKFFIEITD